MARFLKLLLILILCLAAAVVTLSVALNAFLPGKLRDRAIHLLELRTGRKAEIGSVSLNILRDISFNDIRLSEGTRTVAAARSARASYNILSLFSGTFIIDSLEFDTPCVSLERRPDGSMELLKPSPAPEQEKGISVAVLKVVVHEGSLDLKGFPPPWPEGLRDIELSTELSLPRSASFNLSARALGAKGITRGFIHGPGRVEKQGDRFLLRTELQAEGLQYCSGRTKVTADGLVKTSLAFAQNQGLQDYAATADITRCAIETGGKPLVLKGSLELSRAGLSWKAMQFSFAGHDYASSGWVNGFRDPSFGFGIYSQELRLEAQGSVRDKELDLVEFRSSFRGSDLLVKGTVGLASLPALPAEFTVAGNVELADLGLFFDGNPGWQKARPSGKVGGDATLSGDLRDIAGCVINATLKCPKVSVYGLAFGSVNAEYRQKNAQADTVYNFSFYDGTVNATLSIGLKKPGAPFFAQISGDGVLLEKLKEDTPFKGRDLAGKLSSDSKWSGTFGNFRALEGSGTMAVTKGKLWQLDILYRMAQQLLPELLSVTFDRGTGNFTVKDQQVIVDKANLSSPIILLAGKGSSGFDGTVDGVIDIQVSSEILPDLWQLKKFASMILRQTGQVVGVHVTGTRSHPKYQLRQPFLLKVLHKFDRKKNPPQRQEEKR